MNQVNAVQAAEASVTAMEDALSGFTRTTLADLLSEQEALLKQGQEVAQIEDSSIRAAQLEIINANMDSLSAKIVSYREDTDELVTGLEATFQKLGYELTELQKTDPTDLAITKRAEAHLATLDLKNPESVAAKALAKLEEILKEIQESWNPFGKSGRIAEAELAIQRFKLEHTSDVAKAKSALEEAKAEVARLSRKRVREANFDVQFDRFIGIAQQIQSRLLENVKRAEVRMVETSRELNEALKTKEKLAGQIAEIHGTIVTVENELLTVETTIAQTTTQEERARLEAERGLISEKLANLNGQKQEMEIAFNTLESAAVKHETLLQTVRTQCDNQRAHARKLSIDSKARFVQAQNLVVVIKNTAEEDAATRLHSVGSSLDKTSLEIAARALVASERERLAMYTRHEQDMQAFAGITGALAEGRAQIALEDAQIAERMKQNFGIDPLQSSWLHIAEQMGNSASA